MNRIFVIFFATLKDRARVDRDEFEIPNGLTVSDFKKLLFTRVPGLPQSKSNLLVAINKDYAFDQEIIPLGAEVALFPPVSGG